MHFFTYTKFGGTNLQKTFGEIKDKIDTLSIRFYQIFALGVKIATFFPTLITNSKKSFSSAYWSTSRRTVWTVINFSGQIISWKM